MKVNLVMTLMGPDKPGLVEALAKAVNEWGGNWLESRMCHLGGQFAGVLRVAVDSEQEAGLMKALFYLQEQGLNLTLKTEPEQAGNAMGEWYELDLLGQDQTGIVSRISAYLASQGANVEELKTELTTAPMSAEVLFKAHARLCLPSSGDIDALAAGLEDLESDLMVDIDLRKS